MKAKPNRTSSETNPRKVFANGEIRMNASAQNGGSPRSPMQTAHEEAKLALRALATRHGAPPVQTRKRAYFELHNIDSDLATILLLGGPYRGKRIREDMDARGLYLVNGQHGEFVYKLLHRLDQGAIAVPFDASEAEIRRHLFTVDMPVAQDAIPMNMPMPAARSHARIAARIASGQQHAFAQQL
jgi:hypothetical protein